MRALFPRIRPEQNCGRGPVGRRGRLARGAALWRSDRRLDGRNGGCGRGRIACPESGFEEAAAARPEEGRQRRIVAFALAAGGGTVCLELSVMKAA